MNENASLTGTAIFLASGAGGVHDAPWNLIVGDSSSSCFLEDQGRASPGARWPRSASASQCGVRHEVAMVHGTTDASDGKSLRPTMVIVAQRRLVLWGHFIHPMKPPDNTESRKFASVF